MASLDDTNDPTGKLIAAHKVQGANVYSTALEKLGTVEDIMIDKASGRIAYAILSFGGFLGIGDRYYPLPWERLNYNSGVGRLRRRHRPRDSGGRAFLLRHQDGGMG